MSTPVLDSSSLVPVVVDYEGRRWPMFKAGADPLCKDLDLAAVLEFADPHKIRPLIERWSDELGGVSAMVAETTPRGGRPGRAYYLTEEQALFIIAKSETARATWVLKAMIQVFLKARGLVAVAPVNNFAALAEFAEMRTNLQITGQVLTILKDDSEQTKRELAAQREYIEILDKKVNRNGLTKEEREAQANKVLAACECQISELERLMLVHIALDGPATSSPRCGAAARISHKAALRLLERLADRAIIEIEQRDPVMVKYRNYWVITEGLEGHTDDCKKFAESSLDKLLAMTATSTPQPAAMVRAKDGRSVARMELSNHMRMRGVLLGYKPKSTEYEDDWKTLYKELASRGMDTHGHLDDRGRKIASIDYLDRQGWAPEALTNTLLMEKIHGECPATEPASLIYDDCGMIKATMKHLSWLNNHVPVKAVALTEVDSWLDKLMAP